MQIFSTFDRHDNIPTIAAILNKTYLVECENEVVYWFI